jgi:hypothetical protein
VTDFNRIVREATEIDPRLRTVAEGVAGSDPRDILIEQLERSGIPTVVRREREIDAVIAEFNGDIREMAAYIRDLRK